MGSGRDKRKKARERKDGPVAGIGTVKTERKTQKNEAKKERRAEKRIEGDEDDVEAILLRLALEEKARAGKGGAGAEAKPAVVECEPPGPRVSASFVPHVTPRGSYLLMFGGEFADPSTDKVTVFRDMYRFDTDKRKWARIDSPHAPPPRSAHQAVAAKGSMLVFGGEFTSPNQEKFHHYRDLWRLDLATWEWDCLPAKGGPSARSGHRMVLQPLKNRVLLFGGFYDTGREVKYYNDLWELSLETLKWTSLGGGGGGGGAPAAPGPGGPWPSPRSGCGVAVVGDTLWVFGGYSKAKDDEDPELEHGKAMDDVWACNLTSYTWERVKKVGMAPGARASFALAVHAHPKAGPRAFVFGGVSDNEAKGGEDLSSDFHNDLYTFAFERRRWFAAELRPPAKGKQQQGADAAPASSGAAPGADGSDAAAASTSSAAGAGAASSSVVSPEAAARLAALCDKSSALYRAATKIQASYRGYVVRKAYQLYKIGGVVSEVLYSPATYGLDLSCLSMPKPRARIGALMTIVGNTLWLLGGTVEVGSREVTLDDMWALDVQRLDGWSLVRENTVGEELLKAGSGSDSEWTEGSGSEDEDDEEDEQPLPAKAKAAGKAKS
ncbi:hypothetical protein HYH03_017759 [Edaphochlamys debaryana]|uniref:Uncharacterized protein n=1 Tax=Edaphochlamys debaryana TaxID=47281 RepID=A0A835XH86_9CHLO|nr:hypothetical protein HYH03_017759 [Edaphochlamys debaryana]|eukprot:KAG2483359.1 hypothetical protein HYH03_017759 [Edaphochlamys debaryana]